MRRRLVLAAATAALMLVGPMTATGGPYNVEVNRGTAAIIGTFTSDGGLAPVELADGSQAVAFLFEQESSQVRGNFIFPQPDPKADLTTPKEFVGCILIFKADTFDRGCEVLAPSYIETDPAFNETTVVFGVQSFRPDGFRLIATMVLDGQGSPAPIETHAASVTPEPPGAPTLAFAAGSVYLARDAIVRGSIRSDLVGGGAIKTSTTVNSQMWTGLFGFDETGQGGLLIQPGFTASLETEHIVCFPEPQPGDPASPLPPGCHPF